MSRTSLSGPGRGCSRHDDADDHDVEHARRLLPAPEPSCPVAEARGLGTEKKYSGGWGAMELVNCELNCRHAFGTSMRVSDSNNPKWTCDLAI
eukprot:544842-Rhodomonas_salina.2